MRASMPWRRCALLLTVVLLGLAAGSGAAGKNAIGFNEDGWEYLKKENYRRAVFSFKNALQQNARYKEALLGLGRAYLGLEAYEQAYELFDRVQKIDPRSAEAVTGMGLTLTGLGNYAEALKQFDRARALSEDNLEARYGTAQLYARMGKRIWARTMADSILRVEPFHTPTLLLMAELKSADNRLKEAKRFVQKALDANGESPQAYITLGDILFREYLATEDEAYRDEAREALANALSIRPDSFAANRLMGQVSLNEGRYADAVAHFTKALSETDGGAIRYSRAVSHDRAGAAEAAHDDFAEAYRAAPADSILRGRFEDFLVMREYKIGNPSRVMLNTDEYNLAVNRAKKNLADQVIMYLRRALLMNPLNVEARERLMDYYRVQNYDEFYIDELKEMVRLFPEGNYSDRLSVAVVKRRERLTHREGFSAEPPTRDVPGVLVLDFDSATGTSPHPDAGRVMASQLSFVLGQYGRMTPAGMRKRAAVPCGLRCGGEHLAQTLETIEDKVKAGELAPVDYVVYGTFRESSNYLALDCRLMDFNKGFIIGEFSLAETGKEMLPNLVLRAAKRIYAMMPYRGRVLTVKDEGVIVNLGLFDGVTAGDRLRVYQFDNDRSWGGSLRRTIILSVKESDTLLCYAEPLRQADLGTLTLNDKVYPQNKRRARRIE